MWPGEKMGPQFGVHRATARLKGGLACKRNPKLPSAPGPFPASCVLRAGGRQAGWPCPLRRACWPPPFAAFPRQRLEAPKVLTDLVLRVGSQPPMEPRAQGWVE